MIQSQVFSCFQGKHEQHDSPFHSFNIILVCHVNCGKQKLTAKI
jgi:hypothetical protein